MSENKASEFLEKLSTELKAHRTVMDKAKAQLTPEFNVFDVCEVDIIYENHMSRMMTRLLDPNGTHGQGSKFLAEFLQMFNIPPDEFGKGGYERARIKNEHSHENGRIDIFIASQNNNFAIAIENKIDAGDGKDQLKRYSDYLSNNFSNYILFYLNPDGNKPTSESISTEHAVQLKETNKLNILSYRQITEWLMRCKGVSQSPRVDYFLSELINYINRQILGVRDMTEINVIREAILKSDQTLEMTFQIGKQIDTIKQELITKLNSDLVAAFKENYPQWKIFDCNPNVKGFGISNADTGITLCKGDSNIFGIAFEFERTGTNNLYFGVCVSDNVSFPPTHPQRIKFDERVKNLLHAKFGFIKSTEWWPSYISSKDIDKNLADLGFNWGEEAEIWAKINNSTLVIEFVKAFRLIYETLEEDGLAEIFDIKG